MDDPYCAIIKRLPRAVTNKTPLHDIIVTELGGRVGAGVCGSILAQLGATVIVPEDGRGGKAEHRTQLMAGKLSVRLDAQAASDVELLEGLVARSDVLIVSSDVDQLASHARWLVDRKRVVCNVTAFGDSGPLSGKPYSEAQVQALSGILDTTGIASGTPTPIQLPLVEFMTGIYAAVACQAALRLLRRGDGGQVIDMALYDSAFAAMATFLPKLLSGAGGDVGRLGNRHALAAPWNSYRAEDGWVLVCAVSDDQWRRITGLIDRPELARDPRYLRVADRIQRVDEVDAAMQEWVGRNTIVRCLGMLAAAGIPSGPVAPVDYYPHEANLDHRGMIRTLRDPVSGNDVFVPASPLRMSVSPGISPSSIPAPDADRSEVIRLASRPSAPIPTRGSGQAPALPLASVRVIEIGHYTTAPLSARHLANLGAEVIKVEPPTGEETRSWSPAKNGIGYFFAFNNSDKRSLALNLETDEGRAILRDLIVRADVLIENLKPGALAKRGFSADELLRLNPRLVYCAISGFGADSAYPGRAAVDTVIQAMSGIMDLTRAGEVPVKTGISCADIVGAQMAVAAVLGALEVRDRLGIGQAIDLSMQDCTAWVTMPLWGKARIGARPMILKANDGFVVVAPVDTDGAFELPAGAASSLRMTRTELAAALVARGQPAAPVLSAREMLDADQTRARRLVLTRQDGDGEDWPLLASPLGLRGTPPRIHRPVPPLDSSSAAIRAELTQPPDWFGC
jgi:crotonobetainyl-CoA:carnitine CoA-transferase CaiB-like acyl-CoA transferase